jgi:hypothetical protein
MQPVSDGGKEDGEKRWPYAAMAGNPDAVESKRESAGEREGRGSGCTGDCESE